VRTPKVDESTWLLFDGEGELKKKRKVRQTAVNQGIFTAFAEDVAGLIDEDGEEAAAEEESESDSGSQSESEEDEEALTRKRVVQKSAVKSALRGGGGRGRGGSRTSGFGGGSRSPRGGRRPEMRQRGGAVKDNKLNPSEIIGSGVPAPRAALAAPAPRREEEEEGPSAAVASPHATRAEKWMAGRALKEKAATLERRREEERAAGGQEAGGAAGGQGAAVGGEQGERGGESCGESKGLRSL